MESLPRTNALAYLSTDQRYIMTLLSLSNKLDLLKAANIYYVALIWSSLQKLCVPIVALAAYFNITSITAVKVFIVLALERILLIIFE